MKPIEHYLDTEGRIKRLPKRGKLPLLLSWLADKFDGTRGYTEKEVNELLNRYHVFKDPSFLPYQDPALLRRELVDYRYLLRDDYGGTYRRAPSHETQPQS